MSIERAVLSDFTMVKRVWWESVQRTHTFIDQEYLEELKATFDVYLGQVDLFCWRESDNILGFIGISGDSVEMLFVHPDHMNRGIGKGLLHMAISEYGVQRVDVNEANRLAQEFYCKHGFKPTSRSTLDSQGRPYPIVHMQRS